MDWNSPETWVLLYFVAGAGMMMSQLVDMSQRKEHLRELADALPLSGRASAAVMAAIALFVAGLLGLFWPAALGERVWTWLRPVKDEEPDDE
jgi:hypothetical protein